MSDPITVVRAIYDAVAAGDGPGIVAHYAPDMRITQTRELPWGGEYEGLAGYGQFAKALRQHIQSRVEIERIFAAGDDVVVIGHTVGATKEKQTPFRVAIAHVLTVREGKVVAARYFIDTPAMLAALNA